MSWVVTLKGPFKEVGFPYCEACKCKHRSPINRAKYVFWNDKAELIVCVCERCFDEDKEKMELELDHFRRLL